MPKRIYFVFIGLIVLLIVVSYPRIALLISVILVVLIFWNRFLNKGDIEDLEKPIFDRE